MSLVEFPEKLRVRLTCRRSTGRERGHSQEGREAGLGTGEAELEHSCKGGSAFPISTPWSWGGHLEGIDPNWEERAEPLLLSSTSEWIWATPREGITLEGTSMQQLGKECLSPEEESGQRTISSPVTIWYACGALFFDDHGRHMPLMSGLLPTQLHTSFQYKQLLGCLSGSIG